MGNNNNVKRKSRSSSIPACMNNLGVVVGRSRKETPVPPIRKRRKGSLSNSLTRMEDDSSSERKAPTITTSTSTSSLLGRGGSPRPNRLKLQQQQQQQQQ